ncbi:helix-turn-helix domain-containing protein [Amycolatopsis bullii]|uniref:Transposase IS30-like HTH domain-containing protein n=1 Tax=Amycolatopsis bullii TaxID=941987 RepID=A0ABQ3KIT1_9PSEU|nr:helix-turn-helix domain-containing protein [Amycolatopsis bullii]GHG17838.1 hypothetical protein GCM10017567_40230 [Amycolatopsis bullii]
MSSAERIRIADGVRQPGMPLRMVAVELGRPVSTISRELVRNQQSDGSYQPHAAHELATGRRARPKIGKLAAIRRLRAIVEDGVGRAVEPAADHPLASPRPP